MHAIICICQQMNNCPIETVALSNFQDLQREYNHVYNGWLMMISRGGPHIQLKTHRPGLYRINDEAELEVDWDC